MTTGATDALSATTSSRVSPPKLIPEEAQTSTAYWTSWRARRSCSPQAAQGQWEQIKAVPNEWQSNGRRWLRWMSSAIFSLGELHKNGELTPTAALLRTQLAPGTLSGTVGGARTLQRALAERSRLDDAFYLKPQAVLATTRVMRSPATSPAPYCARVGQRSAGGRAPRRPTDALRQLTHGLTRAADGAADADVVAARERRLAGGGG